MCEILIISDETLYFTLKDAATYTHFIKHWTVSSLLSACLLYVPTTGNLHSGIWITSHKLTGLQHMDTHLEICRFIREFLLLATFLLTLLVTEIEYHMHAVSNSHILKKNYCMYHIPRCSASVTTRGSFYTCAEAWWSLIGQLKNNLCLLYLFNSI